jgi:hypothetical protein
MPTTNTSTATLGNNLDVNVEDTGVAVVAVTASIQVVVAVGADGVIL